MPEKFGSLERVELRKRWKTENRDFTPWLAKEKNLSLLAETLNLDLELEDREVSVGEFQADILCRNTLDNSWVVIENQLEKTDHEHLGKLLTYAAGLDAATVVWIAKEFRDEHRAALDRQNEITDERLRYFGVEIELWQIGKSSPAPKFNIVSKPNDWRRNVLYATSGDLTETQLQQIQYWTELSERMSEADCGIGPLNPVPKPYVFLAIGKGGIRLRVSISKQKKRLSVWLDMFDEKATAHFNLLVQDRAEIDQEFGASLEWNELPGKKSCQVSLHKDDTDPTAKEDWPNQHAWLAEKLELFNNVFRYRVRNLNADDWQPEEEDDE